MYHKKLKITVTIQTTHEVLICYRKACHTTHQNNNQNPKKAHNYSFGIVLNLTHFSLKKSSKDHTAYLLCVVQAALILDPYF